MRRFVLSGLLIVSLLVTGCSALRVSTAEGDSAPVKVGVGDESQETPTAATPTLPPGMTEVAVDVGSTCPVPIRIAMDDGWQKSVGYDGYQLFMREDTSLMSVNCFEDNDVAPSDVVTAARESMFSEAGSQMVSEATGKLPGGEYWTITGALGPDDLRAIETTESTIVGALAGVQAEGRQFQVSVEMVAKAENEASVEIFSQMLPTLTIADVGLTPPPALN